MATSPARRLIAVATALGLVLGAGACASDDPPSAATATGAVPGTPGVQAAPVSTSPARAIGQAQRGTLPVWLTSYAVLPWTNHVEQAGRHTFTVSNRSLQRHSFGIIQFDGDVRALPRSSNLIATTQVKVVAQTEVIEPGREVDLAVDLPAGRYVLTSLFAQDYTDGMAAAFTVGGSGPSGPVPRVADEGALGAYLLEYGAFFSNGQVRAGETHITVQNLGARAREFVLVRWRGAEDTLPVRDGTILLDGLQEVHRFETLPAGGERQIEVDLKSGFSYVVASLTRGEYTQGIHAQVKVN